MADEEIMSEIEISGEQEQGQSDNEHNPKKKGYFVLFGRILVLGGCALVLFVIFFIFFMMKEGENKAEYSPEIVIMGDSIFAHTTDESSVANLLGNLMNVSVADVSFGGSCMSYIDKDARMDNNHDAFCMAALTQAVLAEDFRYQHNANVRLNATEYFDERVALLETIDFSQVNILIIDHLLNDYQISANVECGSDEYDEYTYEGAMRSVITQLKEEYPNLRIIVVAPVKSWYTDDCISSSEYDFGNGTIDKYIEVQKEITDELGVEWLSLYDLYDGIEYTTDHIHPNEEARVLIADYLYEYLKDGE